MGSGLGPPAHFTSSKNVHKVNLNISVEIINSNPISTRKLQPLLRRPAYDKSGFSLNATVIHDSDSVKKRGTDGRVARPKLPPIEY
jgi:hypothetical protein